MDTYILSLINKHKSRKVVVDSNLMLLAIVGLYSPELIGRSRTARFIKQDYPVLMNFLRIFPGIITTPNIMTEVNNLSRQIIPDRAGLQQITGTFCYEMVEIYLPTEGALGSRVFREHGLTDAQVVALAEEHLVITNDFRLHGWIENLRLDSININHIRRFE